MRRNILIGIIVVIIVAVAPFVILFSVGGAKERLLDDVTYIGYKQDEWLTREFTISGEERGWKLSYNLDADNATTRYSAYVLKCDVRTFLTFKSPSEWENLVVWKSEGGNPMKGETTPIDTTGTYTFIFKASVGGIGRYKLMLVRP